MATASRSSLDALLHDDLRRNVSPLEDRRSLLLALAVLPVPLTMAFFVAHSIVTGTPRSAYGLPLAYLTYGVANVVTVGVLFLILTADERRAVFRFSRPGVTELTWAAGAFLMGLGVYQLTSRVSGVLGFELRGLSYSLAEPATVLVVVLGAVVIAPITEEVIYRGFVLGLLLARGVGAASAVGLMTALFALIHLPNFGVAGTIFISVWGILPAVLRLRFDSLSGTVAMHMLNNVFAYLVVVGLGWAWLGASPRSLPEWGKGGLGAEVDFFASSS